MIVLDASALLCVLFEEPGMEQVIADGQGAFVSAVNLCEMLTKASDRGVPIDIRSAIVTGLVLRIVDLDTDAATEASALREPTKAHGLSLGDRACLALARRLGATVLTTDRQWSRLDLGITVRQLR